jgi:hypothetical protein
MHPIGITIDNTTFKVMIQLRDIGMAVIYRGGGGRAIVPVTYWHLFCSLIQCIYSGSMGGLDLVFSLPKQGLQRNKQLA